MQIFGVMMVRNEADILPVNVQYHLALGLDGMLIVDNASSDGTDRILAELARDPRVIWMRDDGPKRQVEITTTLARQAFFRGADWVIPIDADEFWYAPRKPIRQVLQEAGPAGALHARIVNFIQARDQVDASPHALLRMTRRPPAPIGPISRIAELVGSRQIAFIEAEYPRKCVAIASPGLRIGVGNHWVTGVPGPVIETDEIVCLHAPLRARSILEAQIEHGRRTVEAGDAKAWHLLRWYRMGESAMQAEWLANSYEDECLDVYGQKHSVVFDPRLRDAVKPWVERRITATADPAAPDSELLKGVTPAWHDTFVADVLSKSEQIEGSLTRGEAVLLMAMVARALAQPSPGAIVEIGIQRGRPAVLIDAVCNAIWPCTAGSALDARPSETAPTDANILTWTLDECGPAQRLAPEADAREPIALLFIGELRDPQTVSADLLRFAGRIPAGGYLLLHRSVNSTTDVRAPAYELLATDHYRKVQQAGTILVAQKLPADVDCMEEQQTSSPDCRDKLHARLTRAIALLEQLYQYDVSRQQAEIRNLEELVGNLTSELHEKVAERDRIIRDVQAELHQKVGERDRIIRGLQSELHAKVEDRDRIIAGLQQELHAKTGERDQIIRGLQSEIARLKTGLCPGESR